MEKSFRVQEVAKFIARGKPNEEIDLVLRQLRYWTVLGVVFAEQQYPRPGRHRRYDSHAVFCAAVIYELSMYGFHIGLMKEIGEALAFEFPKKERAVDYLIVKGWRQELVNTRSSQHFCKNNYRIVLENKLNLYDHITDDCSMVFVNLTRIKRENKIFS